MIVIEKDTLIRAPVERVWNLLSNHERMPEWAGMKTVTITNKSDGVGLKCTCDFGRFKADEEVVEWEENRKIVHNVFAMGMPMKESWTLEPSSGGTRFVWRQEIHTRGFKKLLSPMIKRQVNQAFDKGIQQLKLKLEE